MNKTRMIQLVIAGVVGALVLSILPLFFMVTCLYAKQGACGYDVLAAWAAGTGFIFGAAIQAVTHDEWQ